jgi:transposase-like protein
MEKDNIPNTLQEAVKYFSNDLTCINFVAQLRWSDGIAVCPHCQGEESYFLATRKIWKCKNRECGKQFSVKLGTIFEDSPIRLEKWLMAIWMIANCKNGISSYELHRAIGITQKSAWFVLHRIRIAMEVGTIEKLSGEVECDETYIGGLSKNMHFRKRKAVQMKTGGSSKTAVMGMLERKGRVKGKVIKLADTPTLLGNIGKHVEIGSTVYTDDHGGYRNMSAEYIHEVINHAVEYVHGHIHTNGIENFWSLLKRTIKGTYVSVDPSHLQSYVVEQEFRYNEREGNDQSRFFALIQSISGKRLTYAQLIGYETRH